MTLKRWIKLAGRMMLLGGFVTMLITFIIAYSSPDKTVSVMINTINEAHFEALALLFLTPAAFYSMWDDIRK